jgi:molybdopterin converting factor small subunit
MHIQVKLFATLAERAALTSWGQQAGIRVGHAFDMDLVDGSGVSGLIERLALPLDEIKVAFVNGRARPLAWRLHDGDEVGIFPPIGGG